MFFYYFRLPPSSLNASTRTIRVNIPATATAVSLSAVDTDAMNAIPASTSITAMSRMVLKAWLSNRLAAIFHSPLIVTNIRYISFSV